MRDFSGQNERDDRFFFFFFPYKFNFIFNNFLYNINDMASHMTKNDNVNT